MPWPEGTLSEHCRKWVDLNLVPGTSRPVSDKQIGSHGAGITNVPWAEWYYGLWKALTSHHVGSSVVAEMLLHVSHDAVESIPNTGRRRKEHMAPVSWLAASQPWKV